MFIYKITNKINGKIYIGQTIQSLEKRWNQHKYESVTYRKNQPLHNAMRKYDIDNFIIEEIDGANSLSELNYKEWLLIYQFNSLVPNGYNSKEGGNRPKYSKKTKVKMSKSAKIRSNKKEHIDDMKNKNPMFKKKNIEKRLNTVYNNKTYSRGKNPRYINIDKIEFLEIFHNKEKYYKIQDMAKYFNVSKKVIENRIKWWKLKRKIKKPRLVK